MAQPLIAAMPNDVTMAAGYVVRIVALNPATGDLIAGVRATDVAFQVQSTSPTSSDPGATFDPIPLLVPTNQTT